MSSVTFTLSKTGKKNLDRLSEILGRNKLFGLLDKFFHKHSLIAASHISKTMLSGQRLRRRTGGLAKSVTGTGLRVDGIPAMRVGIFRGPALKYAGVQELGTKGKNPSSPYDTIRPKKGKSLSIPLDPVLTGTGVDKYGGPRGFPGELHFIPFRKSGIAVGALFDDAEYKIAKTFGLREAKAAYLLVKKVDIPAHFYLRDGFRNYLPLFVKELEAYLKQIVAIPQQ